MTDVKRLLADLLDISTARAGDIHSRVLLQQDPEDGSLCDEITLMPHPNVPWEACRKSFGHAGEHGEKGGAP